MITLRIKEHDYVLTDENENELFTKLALKYKPRDKVTIFIDYREEETMELQDLINF